MKIWAAILVWLALTITAILATPVQSQLTPAVNAPNPKWEVVSVKPCKQGERGTVGNRGGGRGENTSPDTLRTPCQTSLMLIRQAYVTFANGRLGVSRQLLPIEGGPSWIKSEFYQITAKAERNTTQEIMMGPMLRALLEDRFKLKIHREHREVPAFALTVGKDGPKLKEGSCIAVSSTNPPPKWDGKSEPPRLCGSDLNRLKPNGDRSEDLFGATVNQFSAFLSSLLSRPVVDKTGINGTFDFHFEYAPERDSYPPNFVRSDDPPGASIFTAIQEQLGLKLDATKAPGEFLIIDSIDRPTEN